MHINKHFLFVVGIPALLVAVIIYAGMYRFYSSGEEQGAVSVNDGISLSDEQGIDTALIDPMEGNAGGRIMNPDTPMSSGGGGKLAADVFTGTLTKVDTGCFADGECYVEVGGNHVTVLMGWSRETVGTVQGVEGFGDLEAHIGAQIEVYAQRLSPGNYTLYGSEGFYVRLLGKGAGTSGQTTPGSSGSAGGGTSGSAGIAIGEPNPSTPRPTAGPGCVVGGCSSQLCVDASEGDIASTCEWREEYGCYQTATCEKQSNGQCGWTPTPELTQCRADAAENDEPMFIVQ